MGWGVGGKGLLRSDSGEELAKRVSLDLRDSMKRNVLWLGSDELRMNSIYTAGFRRTPVIRLHGGLRVV